MTYWLRKLIALSVLAGLILAGCQAVPTQPAPLPTVASTAASSGAISPTAPAGTSTPEPEPTDGPLAPVAQDRFAAVDPKGQKIVYWHAQSDKNQAALEKIIQDFNASNNEGITVEAVGLGSEKAVFQKAEASLKTQDQPGLLDASQDHAATYQQSGALADLNGLVTSAKWGLSTGEFNDLPSGVMAQDVYTVYLGVRLGFPVFRSMDLLYANQDWLKELGLSQVPQSPQEFKAAACKAVKQPYSKSSSQEGAGVGLVISKDTNLLTPLIYAFGGDIFGSANNFYTLGSDPALKAAAFLQDLAKEGCARLSPDSAAAQKIFGAGGALFMPGSLKDLPLISGQVAGGGKFAWTVGPLPHEGESPVVTAPGLSLSILKSTPEKELAAWLFIKYLLNPTVQAEWATASGFLPVRGAAGGELESYFSQNPAEKTAFDLLKFAKPEPPVPGSGLVNEKIAQALVSLVSSPYPDPKTILTQLNQDANQALQDQLAKQK